MSLEIEKRVALNTLMGSKILFGMCVIGLLLMMGGSVVADIKRLDGNPINFNTANKTGVARVSDIGLGIHTDANQALHVSGNGILTGNLLLNQHIVSSELSSSPTAPSSGFGYLYVKNDGSLYFKNDAGNEFDLSSGSGGGAFSTVSGNAVFATGSVGINDSTPEYGLDVDGSFRVVGAALFDSTVLSQALTATTVDTGQGVNELYAMNQNVLTTSAVTFSTINTGQGANELYDMNQNVLTTSAVTFSIIDTGHGVNELYSMNQNVMTTSSVSFAGLTGTGVLSIDDTTDASSSVTGSIHTDGGVGVVKYMVVGQGAVFNESGVDSDTRIEGDSKSNLFYLDASADRIGLNTNTPDNFLDIESETRSGSHASGRSLYVTGGFGQHSSGVEFRHSNATQGIGIGYDGLYATGTNSDQKFVIQAKGSGEVVVNEDSANQDFRVESNSDANMLFVDASADQIGLRDSTPSYTLDVSGTLRATTALKLDSTLTMGVQSISSNTTLGSYSVALVDTSSNDVTVTLPAASVEAGRIYMVKKTVDSNILTLSGNIDASLNYTFSSGNTGSLSVVSDGSAWFIIDEIASGVAIEVDDPWTPAEISTTMWFDADDVSTITHSSNKVSQWSDKSGNDFHVTQGTDNRRPIYNSTGWSNGKGQLEMDELTTSQAHTLGRTVTSDGITGSAYTLFVVVNARQTDSEGWIHTDSNTGGKEGRFQINNNGVKVRSDSSNGGTTTGSYTTGEQILMFTLNGSSSVVYRNGTEVASNSGTFTATALTGDFTVNGRNSSDGHAGMDGDLAEFIFLTRSPSVSEREKIEGYLAHKWGLEGSLPSGHTYENSAP